MSRNVWLELIRLAEALCPPLLLDLHAMLETDARGILLWLRSKTSKEA